jgi:hypothetical protein
VNPKYQYPKSEVDGPPRFRRLDPKVKAKLAGEPALPKAGRGLVDFVFAELERRERAVAPQGQVGR